MNTKSTRQTPDLHLYQQLEQIAFDHCFVETLTTRHSDRLDFYELSVWALKSAIEAAYAAGVHMGREER